MSSGGIGLNSQRNTFYHAGFGKYWLFYVDTAGNVIRARYSTDGASWTYEGYVPGAVVTSGVYLSTTIIGNSVYVAYREGDSIKVQKGTIWSNADITWGGEYTAFSGTSGSDSYTYPSISRQTNGKLWVVAKYTNGTSHRQKAIRSTYADNVSAWGARINASAFVSGAYVVPQMLQLPGGHMYNVYLEGTAIKGRRWNNSTSSFDAAVTIASTYAADLNHIPSAVINGSESIYVGYADSSRNLKYRRLASGYTGSWIGPNSLADSDTGTNVALTRQTGTAGLLYAFYASPPGSSARVKQVKITEPANKLNLSPTGDWDQIIAPSVTNAQSYAVWRKKNTDVWFSRPRVLPVTSLAVSPTRTASHGGSDAGCEMRFCWAG